MSAADEISDGLLSVLGAEQLDVLSSIADHLIPGAHGMPSAADVVDESRLLFVLQARPDLVEPLRAALRNELPAGVEARLETLEAKEPIHLAAVQLAIVGAYYTDARVRELIGYPGQVAKPVNAHEYPEYMSEGLLDAALTRGPVWRNPDAGAGEKH